MKICPHCYGNKPPPYKPAWIHSDHYHCKCCGSVIECAVALGWHAVSGDRRVGVCRSCGQILIENESTTTRLVWPEEKA